MIYTVISFGPANEFASTYTDVASDLPTDLAGFDRHSADPYLKFWPGE